MGNNLQTYSENEKSANFNPLKNEQVHQEGELVTIQNDQPVTTSRQIAETFEKDHRNVLRDIDALKDVLNFEQMFQETQFPDSYGRPQRAYLLNRDGFSLLAMGFTGDKALQWKLKYLAAFNKMEEHLSDPDYIIHHAMDILNARCEKLMMDNNLLVAAIVEAKPKLSYYDMILKNKSLMNTSVIAQDYGMSAVAFNKLLHDQHIQHRVGDQWILYIEHQGNGYVHSETYDYRDRDGNSHVTATTKWTQKGRLWLYEKLRLVNILPSIEKGKCV